MPGVHYSCNFYKKVEMSCFSGIADNSGFAVCPYFVGHGIGEEFHGTPQILHHRNSFGGILEEGMVFTIGMELST